MHAHARTWYVVCMHARMRACVYVCMCITPQEHLLDAIRPPASADRSDCHIISHLKDTSGTAYRCALFCVHNIHVPSALPCPVSPAPALSLHVNFIVTAIEIPEYGQFLAETTGNNDRPTAPGREHGTARNSSARNSSARHSPASCCRLRNCCRQHMIRVRMHAGDLNRMSMRAFTCACLHAHPRKQMAHTYGSPVLIRMYTGTHNAHVCMSVHIERTAHTRGFV